MGVGRRVLEADLANLGSAINPLLEGARRDDLASYRLPAGNLINRLVGVIAVAPFLGPIAHALLAIQPDAARMVAGFHTIASGSSAAATKAPPRPMERADA